MSQVVKPHLAHATSPQSALEATHEVGVVEHGPALGMAEHQIVVGLVRRRLVVTIQFARESIRHRHRAGRPPRLRWAPVSTHVRPAHTELAGQPVDVAPLQPEQLALSQPCYSCGEKEDAIGVAVSGAQECLKLGLIEVTNLVGLLDARAPHLPHRVGTA